MTSVECDIPVIVEFDETESIFERNLSNSSVTSNHLFDVAFFSAIIESSDVNSGHFCNARRLLFLSTFLVEKRDNDECLTTSKQCRLQLLLRWQFSASSRSFPSSLDEAISREDEENKLEKPKRSTHVVFESLTLDSLLSTKLERSKFHFNFMIFYKMS